MSKAGYWLFDKEGKLDLEPSHAWFRLSDPFRAPKGKVVDIRPEIERSKWRADNLWDITAEDLGRLTAALWPGIAQQPEEVAAVKGKAARKPPLTSDARDALRDIVGKTGSIGRKLEELTEPGLKGFAYAAREHARTYPGERLLWEAIAAEADRHREINARHRTGKGVFYASLTIWHWTENRR